MLDSLQHITRSRYLGGNSLEAIEDLVDVPSGGILAVGGTASSDFPVTDGSTGDSTVPSGCVRCPYDATVTRIDPDGTIRWSRILGGVGYDYATSAVADASGIYIAGSTAGGIATTAGAGDRTFAGGSSSEYGLEDGFACRLDAATGATQWCTYVGGNGPGGVTDITVRGDLYVTIQAAAAENLQADPDYAAAFASGLRSTPQGADGVILQLAAADGHFVAATYVGGTGDEYGPASLVADGGYIHYLGGTASTDVPTPGGFLTTAPAGTNLFFTTFAPGLGAMQYGTYIGGDGDDTTDGDALAGWNDTAEVVAIGITTTSTALPTRLGVAQATYGGDGGASCGTGDAWLAVIRPTSAGDASLLSATYLGGSAGEYVGAVSTMVGSSLVAVAGRTWSADFPTARGARTTWNGPTCEMAGGPPDAYVALVDVDTGAHAATFLGGNQLDRVSAIAGTRVGGVTNSPDFPTTPAGGDTTLDGDWDGFLTEFSPFPPPPGGGDGGATDGGPTDATTGFESLPGDYVFPPADDDGGCCGAAPAPVAPGMLALGGLVMLLVRRRRVR